MSKILAGKVIVTQDVKGQLAILGVSEVELTTTDKNELPTAQLLLITLKAIQCLHPWTLMSPTIHIHLPDSAFMHYIDDPVNLPKVGAQIMDLIEYPIEFYAGQSIKKILHFWLLSG